MVKKKKKEFTRSMTEIARGRVRFISRNNVCSSCSLNSVKYIFFISTVDFGNVQTICRDSHGGF